MNTEQILGNPNLYKSSIICTESMSYQISNPSKRDTMKFVSDYGVNIPVVILIIPTLLVIFRLKGLFILTGNIFLTTLGAY